MLLLFALRTPLLNATLMRALLDVSVTSVPRSQKSMFVLPSVALLYLFICKATRLVANAPLFGVGAVALVIGGVVADGAGVTDLVPPNHPLERPYTIAPINASTKRP